MEIERIRTRGRDVLKLSYPDVEIQLDTRLVNGTVRLTEREASALRYLADRAGEVVRRERLEREVWGFRPGVRSEAVPVTIRRIRAKIERDPDHPSVLLTVHGRGWRLVRPLAPSGAGRAGAPGFATPFLERAELDAICERLSSGHRLTTLLGPGGAGKTRLAAEIARTTPRSVFVELAGSTTEAAVATAVGTALGVEATLLDLARMLGSEALVVLDGAEDAVDAVGRLVAAAVRASGEVRILVTSRVALGVAGEAVCTIGGLDDALAERFVGARIAAAGGRPPPPETLRAVARAVGGLPLALELCAGALARGAETVESALADLPRDDRMATTIRWSWERLLPEHRQLLVDCALFRSPFDGDAARQVLGPGADAGLQALRRAWWIDQRSDRWFLPPLLRGTLTRRPSEPAALAYRGWLTEQMDGLMEGWRVAPADACDRAAELRDDLEAAVGGDDPVLAARAALCAVKWREFDGPPAGPWLVRVRGPLPPRLAAEVALARSVQAVDDRDRALLDEVGPALADPLPWPDLELRRRVHFVVLARWAGDPEGALRWLPLVPAGADLTPDDRCFACHWTSGTLRSTDPAAADRARAEGYALSVRAGLPVWQALFLNSPRPLHRSERRTRNLERAVALAIACRRRTTAVVGLLNLRTAWLVDDAARAAALSQRAFDLATTVRARLAAAVALGMDRLLADDPEGGLAAVEPWIGHVGSLEAAQAEEYRLYHAALLAACGDTEQARARFDQLDLGLLRERFRAPAEEVDLLVLLLRREIDVTEGLRGDGEAAERARAAGAAARTWAGSRPLGIRLLAALVAHRCTEVPRR